MEYKKELPTVQVNQPPGENPKKKKGLAQIGRKNTTGAEVADDNSKLKVKKLDQISNPNAKLTLRVTTRWYRAP